MNSNRIGRTVGVSAAAFALVGLTACGGETPQVPNEMPQVPGVGDPQQAFGDAHQKALGLAALGGVGMEQGAGQQVQDLAPQVQAEGQQLNEKMRGMASAVGVSLPDQVSPETQAQVDDLSARAGDEFDPAWLQAAQEQVGQMNEQAQGLMNVPGLPPDQVEQAQAQLTSLGDLKTKLDEAAAAAGAATPGGEAGSGEGDAAGSGEGNGTGEGDGAGEGGQAAGPESGSGGSGADGSGSEGSGSEGSGSEGSGSEGTAGSGSEGTAGSGNGSGNGSANGSGNGSGQGPAVDAGTGGQAASSSDAVLPVAIGGTGLLLLAAGLIRLRRSRA